MKKIFYFHARISGGKNVDSGISIDPEYGLKQFTEQINLCRESGLIKACHRFTVGLNGSESDAESVRKVIWPNGKPSNINLLHFQYHESLIPTMVQLQFELTNYPDCAIGFAHTKGITRPGNRLYQNWRRCLEKTVIENWEHCVADLECGYDVVGAHWTPNSPTDQNSDRWGSNSYFAGAFWWAKASYLATLPALPDKATDRHSWFLPELWLGNGKPKVRDYHQGPIFIHQ